MSYDDILYNIKCKECNVHQDYFLQLFESVNFTRPHQTYTDTCEKVYGLKNKTKWKK